MANLAVSEADIDAADSIMALRYPGAIPLYRTTASRVSTYRAASAAAHNDTSGFEQWLNEVTFPAIWQMWVAAYFGDYESAERLVRPATSPGFSDRERVLAHLTLADLLIARGRWTEAEREFTAAESIAPRRSRLRRAYCLLLPFAPERRKELELAREDLRSWQPRAGDIQHWDDRLSPLLDHARLYLLGLLDARLGDHAAALARADSLQILEDPQEIYGGLARDLASTVRAEVAAQQNDTPRVLEHLDSVKGEVPLQVMNRIAGGPARIETGDLFTQEYARWLRADALRRTGRPEQAARWLEHGFFRIGGNPLFAVALELARAEVYHELGDMEGARRHYATFIRLFDGADPELAPLRTGARERLLELNAEGSG